MTEKGPRYVAAIWDAMDALGYNKRKLYRKMHIDERALSRILLRECIITVPVALKFERVLNISAVNLLKAQVEYQVAMYIEGKKEDKRARRKAKLEDNRVSNSDEE